MCMPVRAGPPSPPHPVVSGCVTAPLTGSSNALSDLCEIAGLLSAAEDSLETNRLLIPSARGEREEAPGTATNQPSITLTDPHNRILARSPLQAYPSHAASALGSHVPLWWMDTGGGVRKSECLRCLFTSSPFSYLSRLMALWAESVSVCLPACVCGGLGGLWCGVENMLRWLGPSRLVLAVRMKVCAGEVEVCHSLQCLQGDVF